MRVSEIMQTDLVSCGADATVVDAAALMTRRRVGACLVVDGPRLAGIFTERDLMRAVAAGTDVRDRRVGELMTREVTLAPPDAEPVWAAEAMKRLGVRHLPVGEDGRVVGIVSLRDLFAVAEAMLRLDPDGAVAARDVLSAAHG